MIMEIPKGIRRYTFDEMKSEMAEEDALFMGTTAFVIGTTWIDYLRLKKYLELMPEFRVIYKTFATTKLRIVKLEQYEEFLEWRKNRNERHR